MTMQEAKEAGSDEVTKLGCSLGLCGRHLVLGTNSVQKSRYDERPQAIRVFYFGNSLTASSMPGLHGELGKSAGKQWIYDAFLGGLAVVAAPK